MASTKSMIINSPFDPPEAWREQMDDGTTEYRKGRRPSRFLRGSTGSNAKRDDDITLVNTVRGLVDAWREARWPGVTSVTRGLLEHWNNRYARCFPLYYCQIEAIETLIWWVEAPTEYKGGVVIPRDGGDFERLCSKMATGTGKTVVMGMIIAWQVLNACAYPSRHHDFSRAVLVVAPGLTVKDRLRVLRPGNEPNVYDDFEICPRQTREKLARADILVINWHMLMPLATPERSVVKKGRESDKAFTRRVLGHMAINKCIAVINDEAHHAWRPSAGWNLTKKQAREQGLDLQAATMWMQGLDRIHRDLRIEHCFDLSATPFVSKGGTAGQDALFDWIVSDFGLNDAIESGLVKTPRYVVRDVEGDDAKLVRPKLHHLFSDSSVSDDLNASKAKPTDELPSLVQQAYRFLGKDWYETAAHWREAGHVVPPVMLTVCNQTMTAARVENYFLEGNCSSYGLSNATKMLRVDSRVLEKAEVGEASRVEKGYEARLHDIVYSANIPETAKTALLSENSEVILRELVDSVGKQGRAGQDLQNVISVSMLSEGWDAKNVTHILGLRAFTSQLLCEQVIGRGLRRVSFDLDDVVGEDGVTRKLFCPEYVNVFGIPRHVLPFAEVDDDSSAPSPTKVITDIEAIADRVEYEIWWPNVVRVDHETRPVLSICWDSVDALILDTSQVPLDANLAPDFDGVLLSPMSETARLTKLPKDCRLQTLTFHAARRGYERVEPDWKAKNKGILITDLISIVNAFCESSKLVVPEKIRKDQDLLEVFLSFRIDMIVEHLLKYVVEKKRDMIMVTLEEGRNQTGCTKHMRKWHTTRKCMPTKRSQISHLVSDSSLENDIGKLLDSSQFVKAWAKNDHLGFHMSYFYQGRVHHYYPSFLVKLSNDTTMVLESKYEERETHELKVDAAARWLEGVNSIRRFGLWCYDVALDAAEVKDLLSVRCCD